MRNDVNIYRKNLTTEQSGYIRVAERAAKKEKTGNFTVVAISVG
jgi:hypothetical protein